MSESTIIVSRFPPPLGGVSVFAQRKAAKLELAGNMVIRVDVEWMLWPAKLILEVLRNRQCRDILVNTTNLYVLALMFLLGILRRATIYDHNSSRRFRSGSLKQNLYFVFVRHARSITVVHQHLLSGYADVRLASKLNVESPFIEPDIAGESSIIAGYPDQVRSFMANQQILKVVNSAWKYVGTSAGADLYGIELSLKLIFDLVSRGVDAQLLLAFGDFNRGDMPRRLRHLIELGCERRLVVILRGQKELWPLFRSTDIFLRLTSTDGESVSVLEAQHFGCSVVASDVVPRPSGVITYAYGDDADLLRAVESAAKRRIRLVPERGSAEASIW